MASANSILVDSVIIATVVLEITDHTGESLTDGLARLFPDLDAGDAAAIANDAQIIQERKENAALPDA